MNLTAKTKLIIISFVLIIVTIICYFIYLVWFNPPPPAENIPPSVQLHESRLIGRKDGERQWEILTNSVLQAEGQVTLTEMDKITLFQEQEPYFLVDAEKAIWDRRKNNLELYNAVIVQIDDEFKLESNLLILNEKDSTLTSPGQANIDWQGLAIVSEEMILEMETGLLHLKAGVEIKDREFSWKMSEAIYDLDNDLMDFYGVVIFETEVEKDEQ